MVDTNLPPVAHVVSVWIPGTAALPELNSVLTLVLPDDGGTVQGNVVGAFTIQPVIEDDGESCETSS